MLVGAACTGYATSDELELREPEPRAETPVREIPDAAPVVDDESDPKDSGAARERDRRGPPAPGIPDDAKVVLERTACYGRCPIYTVTLAADGEVHWQGERFVETLGEAHGSITPDQFAELWRELEEPPYAKLPSKYTGYGSPFCKSYATDNPTAIVTVVGGGETHRVVHYHGCRGFEPLEAFEAIEERIDDVAGSKQWVGRCAEEPCR